MSCQIKGKYDIMPLFVSMLVTKVDLQKRIEKRLEHFNCKSTGNLKIKWYLRGISQNDLSLN